MEPALLELSRHLVPTRLADHVPALEHHLVVGGLAILAKWLALGQVVWLCQGFFLDLLEVVLMSHFLHLFNLLVQVIDFLSFPDVH